MTARIGVVIPCFNHGRFLRDAVDSVLRSDQVPVQVVVVDDGSSDDTAAVARSYGDRVLLVQQANRGLPAARNAGFAAATAELLCFLDADDRVGDGFVPRMLVAVDAHPEVAAFCGAWRRCDEMNRPLDGGRVVFPAEQYRFLLGGNPMPCHAVVVRRAALTALPGAGSVPGPFDETLPALEDWDLWLRLAAAGRRFATVADAVVDYRRYEGSMSRDVARMLRAARLVLGKHRGRHAAARLRAMRAIRYGMYVENVLPELRRGGAGAFCRALWRHPALLESVLLHALFTACPPLRRRLGVAEGPFVRRQEPRSRSAS